MAGLRTQELKLQFNLGETLTKRCNEGATDQTKWCASQRYLLPLFRFAADNDSAETGK